MICIKSRYLPILCLLFWFDKQKYTKKAFRNHCVAKNTEIRRNIPQNCGIFYHNINLTRYPTKSPK